MFYFRCKYDECEWELKTELQYTEQSLFKQVLNYWYIVVGCIVGLIVIIITVIILHHYDVFQKVRFYKVSEGQIK